MLILSGGMLVARPYRPTTRPLVSEVCPARHRQAERRTSIFPL